MDGGGIRGGSDLPGPGGRVQFVLTRGYLRLR
jgi:hypothetical protein